MRPRLSFLALLGLSACTKTPTTTGSLGELDFAGDQPAGVVIPPNAPLKTYEGKQVICSGDAEHPGPEVKVNWKVYEKAPEAYITHAAFDVSRPADGFEVMLPKDTKNVLGGASLTPGAPWIGSATVSIKCQREAFRSSYHGSDFIQFDATGKLHAPPSRSP